MSYAELPFDTQEALRDLRRWVECESPSWDAAAVSRMVGLAASHFAALGATVHMLPGERGFGECALADFAPDDPAPCVLVLCHCDTVHPIGTLATTLPWREEDGRCYGPGLFDMKSGTYLAAAALAQLARAGLRPALPVRVLLTSDEESGTPSTRALIEASARRAKVVLVPEGAQPNGNLVSGRFPALRLRLWTHGRSSHALLQRTEGRSALLAMARLVQRIEALNGDGEVAYTVVLLESGRSISSVPVEAYAEVTCSARSEAALDAVIPRVEAIAREEGADLTVGVKIRRPLWAPCEGDVALQSLARGLMRELGIAADCEALFGGSDGNLTGALGIPTLDGLGPVGADAHQLTENIEVASLAPRCRLLAGLLATLT
ncbi:MAG: M20/M25/M40 family metallo-hydrolase [Acidisphaera sp.]|nr:M20/M25/M40 family metallo-hydrolase [Acidisphaera sp.]MBV9813318.1 M20/M25/M40 family metallo-hydrolase [Acetobacteraceae bacterium]